MTASLSVIARRFSFVREAGGPNRGVFVEFIQRRGGDGVPGDSWCADFVSLVMDIAYRGASPLRKTGSTKAMFAEAKMKGFVEDSPQPDDLYFFVDKIGVPHHVGIITGIAPVTGIAGNTSEDGKSSNGTGVFEHPISMDHVVFVRLPK